MENHHFLWENPLWIVIFHSYGSQYQGVLVKQPRLIWQYLPCRQAAKSEKSSKKTCSVTAVFATDSSKNKALFSTTVVGCKGQRPLYQHLSNYSYICLYNNSLSLSLFLSLHRHRCIIILNLFICSCVYVQCAHHTHTIYIYIYIGKAQKTGRDRYAVIRTFVCNEWRMYVSNYKLTCNYIHDIQLYQYTKRFDADLQLVLFEYVWVLLKNQGCISLRDLRVLEIMGTLKMSTHASAKKNGDKTPLAFLLVEHEWIMAKYGKADCWISLGITNIYMYIYILWYNII